MKIAILGFGREGKSLLKFLKKTRINADGHADKRRYKNISENLRSNQRKSVPREIWVLDKKPMAVSSIKYQVAGTQTGKNYLKRLERFDVIFRSPGIPYLLPEIQKAKKQGVKISSATNLFFERCPGTIVGITGTKGKGTTSTLLYKILKAAGKKVFLAGNIGKPALDILSNAQINADGRADKRRYKNISENLRRNQRESAYVILELSSFQLQDLKISPSIAAVLDIFPDHLDAHKNLKEYYDAKANIGRYQKTGDKIFFFGNNNLSRCTASKGKGKKIAVYPECSRRVDEKSFKLFSPDDLLVKGAHNFKNAVMAATIAESFGVSKKIILKAVLKFRCTEHRLELARKIVKNGKAIYFYNDSASTNPQTAAAAIKAFPDGEKILIAGGQDKNLDYKSLANALRNSKTNLVILFGENKKKIEKAISKSGVPIKLVRSLEEAVTAAYRQVTRSTLLTAHCNILFSPAATSFDMFENYADRGKKFKKIVKQLI